MRRDGFTFVELLIVMGIIGILASIAAPRFDDTRHRAYVATMQSDLNRLIFAQQAHVGPAGGSYAAELDELSGGFLASPGVTLTIVGATQEGWTAEAEHAATTRTCSYSTDTNVIVCGEAAVPEEPSK